MTLRLLVAEDSRTMQRVMQIAFAQEDAMLQMVASAQQARAAMAQGEFDAVLLDVDLPETDGYTLCAELRSLHSEDPLPVLLLTSVQHPLDPARAQHAGACGHIDKPFATQDLVQAVFAAAGQKMRHEQAAAQTQLIHDDGHLLPQQAQHANSAFGALEHAPIPGPGEALFFDAPPPPLPQGSAEGAHSQAPLHAQTQTSTPESAQPQQGGYDAQGMYSLQQLHVGGPGHPGSDAFAAAADGHDGQQRDTPQAANGQSDKPSMGRMQDADGLPSLPSWDLSPPPAHEPAALPTTHHAEGDGALTNLFAPPAQVALPGRAGRAHAAANDAAGSQAAATDAPANTDGQPRERARTAAASNSQPAQGAQAGDSADHADDQGRQGRNSAAHSDGASFAQQGHVAADTQPQSLKERLRTLVPEGLPASVHMALLQQVEAAMAEELSRILWEVVPPLVQQEVRHYLQVHGATPADLLQPPPAAQAPDKAANAPH